MWVGYMAATFTVLRNHDAPFFQPPPPLSLWGRFACDLLSGTLFLTVRPVASPKHEKNLTGNHAIHARPFVAACCRTAHTCTIRLLSNDPADLFGLAASPFRSCPFQPPTTPETWDVQLVNNHGHVIGHGGSAQQLKRFSHLLGQPSFGKQLHV